MRIGAFVPPWGPTALAADFDRVSKAVEEVGYDSLWIGDHAVLPRSVRSRYPNSATGISPFDADEPLLEPITLLAYLAARTSRVRLGVSVLVLPMRNPVLTAKSLACIDLLSRGRLVLCIGLGWMREEFEVLQADFANRSGLAEEYVSIFRHLWGPRHAMGYEGKRYRFAPIGFSPQPAQPIPILVGGMSDAAIRRAARLGDGWNAVGLSPADVARHTSRLDDLRREAGRGSEPFEVIVRGPLPTDLAAETLAEYQAVGVSEFILDVPNVATDQRIEIMQKVAYSWRRR